MKKFVCTVLAMLLVLSMSACAEEDLLSSILDKGEIIVATEGSWMPWTYHDYTDGGDELVGFDVEVARAIAAKLGVEAKFEECPWDSIFAGIDSKRYDIAANGIELTENRALKYDFTTPYGYIRTALIVRGDNENITCFEDLEGKSTANSIASTYKATARRPWAWTRWIRPLKWCSPAAPMRRSTPKFPFTIICACIRMRTSRLSR